MRRFLLAAFSVFIFSLPAGAGEAEEEMVSFNFDNVQIKTVINKVSELTGKNFVFDEGIVTGTVTLKSPTPIPVSEVYSVLESILEVKNFALVPSKNLVRIFPRDLAGTKSIDVAVGRDMLLLPSDDRVFTQVIPIEHAESAEILATIQPFVSRTGNAIASAKANMIIITDSSSNISRLMRVIKALDSEAPVTDRRVYVYRLANADAETVAQVLTGIKIQTPQEPEQEYRELPDGRRIPVRRPPAAQRDEPEIQIVADKATNALVITCFPREYEVLKEVLSELDRRRQQVLIEALIAEVTLDKLLEIGGEISTWDEPAEGRVRGFGGIDYGIREGFEQGRLSGAVIGAMRGSQIGAILNYYKRDADFKILSSPYIFTRDNEEAQIFIGEDVPFVRESRITDRDLVTPTLIQTYDYRDVGINLRITPHISPQGYVRLKVYQLIEKLREGPTPTTPITVKREIENTVEVEDGNTVVIGGLIRDDEELVESKVPIIGDIPVLGFFFRSKREVREKTSLLIFITPHVIETPQRMLEITGQKQEEGRVTLGRDDL